MANMGMNECKVPTVREITTDDRIDTIRCKLQEQEKVICEIIRSIQRPSTMTDCCKPEQGLSCEPTLNDVLTEIVGVIEAHNQDLIEIGRMVGTLGGTRLV